MKLRILALIFCCSFLFITYDSMTYSSGPPAALTNAPGEGNCTSCHGGSLIQSGTVWNTLSLSSSGGSFEYTPGQTYTLTLSLTETGRTRFGFQITALKLSDGTFAGNFTISDPARTQRINSGPKQYVTHTSAGTSPSSANTGSWSFTWQAPATDVGNVRFYATINAANNDGTDNGDKIYSKLFQFTPAEVIPDAAFSLSQSSICTGNKVIASDQSTGSPDTWNWSVTPATGVSPATSALQNPTFTFSGTGTYTISQSVSNGVGSSGPVSKTVSVFANPTVNAGSDKSACAGSCVTIGTPATTGNTYLWTPPTGLSSSTAAEPLACPSVTTTYKLTVTSTNGCTATDQVVVNLSPSATASAGPDRTLCKGSSVQIGSTAVPGTTYTWTPSTGLSSATSANPTASPTVTTTYKVVASNGGACTASDEVTISVFATPTFSLGPDLTFCGPFLGSIGVSSQLGNDYDWTPSLGLSCVACSNPTAQVTVTTTYILKVTSSNTCSASDAIAITINPLPLADAGIDKSICGGSSVQIGTAAQASTSYLWTPSAGLSSSSTAMPTANPTATTTYAVKVTNSKGCSASDEVIVSVGNINAVLSATPSSTSVCAGTSVTYILTPNAQGTYTFTQGASVLQNGPSNTFILTNGSGTVSISGKVTSTSGCTSPTTQPLTKTFVQPLSAPIISCKSAGLSSVTFEWTAVNGASGYEVSIDGGQNWITPSSGSVGTTHTVSGLTPGQNQNIRVRAKSNGPCSQGAIAQMNCSASNCVAISSTLTHTNLVCPGDTLKMLFKNTGNVAYNVLFDGQTQSVQAGVSTTLSKIIYDNVVLQVEVSDPAATVCPPFIYTESIGTFVKPVANFSASSNGLNAQFTDQSTDAASWVWNFGDASQTSTQQSPSHNYTAFGNYLVELIVSSSDGCSDTISKNIKIEQPVGIKVPSSEVVSVFPNPFDDILFIKTSDSGTIHVRVFSALGLLCYDGSHEKKNGTHQLYLPELSEGIYILDLQVGEKSSRQLIIKK